MLNESHTQAHKIPENKLEHEVFTVETEQCLKQTQRDHAQLQREREENVTLVTTLHISITNSTDKTVSFPSIHAPQIQRVLN